jgi:hypothetical protein
MGKFTNKRGSMTEKKLSRRDAMKMLGVAVGAAALAGLPSKWNTPELAAGVLPAHARQSGHVVAPNLVAGKAATTSLCNFDSTVTINPIRTGILMQYIITPGAGLTINFPPLLTGTTATNPTGVATVNIGVAVDSTAGRTVTVTWSFANASDGTGSSSQIFTSNGPNAC